MPINKPYELGHFIEAYSCASAHILALDTISKYGYPVTVIAGGRPVRTAEIQFMNLVIINPLDPTVPQSTEWTSEVAIRAYADKEILGKIIPDGFTYTYGSELQEPVDQIARVVEILKEDPSSRKATMKIGSPQRLFEQDPPCCVIVDLKLRKHLLNMSLVFRSHDYGSALYPNLRAFGMLQQQIADLIGCGYGILTCTSFSAHVYESDFPKLRSSKWQ